MAMVCPNCVYYNSSDTTCRAVAPPPLPTQQQGNETVAWPIVKATDWCANGWNVTDGFYDLKPRR